MIKDALINILILTIDPIIMFNMTRVVHSDEHAENYHMTLQLYESLKLLLGLCFGFMAGKFTVLVQQQAALLYPPSTKWLKDKVSD